MILFYNKQTKEIIGTIGGRIHSPQQLGMWIGTQEENGRIVLEWKDENPNDLKDILAEFERTPLKVYDYKIELNENEEFTKLVKKDATI